MNYRNVLMGMMQKDVAASLMVDYESGATKGLDNFFPQKVRLMGKLLLLGE
jgi:hypothetical protein